MRRALLLASLAALVRPSRAGTAASDLAQSEQKLVASDAASGDAFGGSASGAGDLNGDGYADLVIGAVGVDDLGKFSGAAYVYYGSADGLDPASERKLRASDGASNAQFGILVAGSGDIDADGYDDLIVCDLYDRLYLYSGSVNGIDAASEEQIGDVGDGLYATVDRAGDLNGDGYADIVKGGGAAGVWYGSEGGLDVDSYTLIVADTGASGFQTVSGAGDVDGDGYDDLVIGAPHPSPVSPDYAPTHGSASVYYGGDDGVETESGDLLTAAAAADYNPFGDAVSGVGDVDGDGYDDLVVGEGGTVTLYCGGPAGVDSTAGEMLTDADGASSDFGTTVKAAGDLDADGFGDLVVSRTYAVHEVPSTFVYYGSASGVDASSEDALTTADAAADDHPVGDGAGDLNGDGRDDLVVGAYGSGANQGGDTGASEGAAYLYEGQERASEGEGGCGCNSNRAAPSTAGLLGCLALFGSRRRSARRSAGDHPQTPPAPTRPSSAGPASGSLR